MGGRIGRIDMVRFLVALVAALMVSLAVPAYAQTPTVTLDVQRGLDGVLRAYTPNLMTVTVTSETLFSGAIEAVSPDSGQAATYRQPVEVPAGGRKTFVLLTPRASVGSVKAVDRAGRTLATARLGQTDPLDTGEPLVGWLAATAPTATTVEVPVVRALATVVPVPIEALSFGEAGLEALSHLVIDGALVPTLSQSQRDALLSFAAIGGEVIVAAADSADVAPLSKSFGSARRGDVIRTAIGRGSLTAAMTPTSDGAWGSTGSMWSRALRPVDIARWFDSRRTESVNRIVAESRLFRRGALAWLLAFVLAYVALVGPINFMVLARMRKREIAWLTVPAISVVFALAGYGLGFASRSSTLHRGAALHVVGQGHAVTETVVGRSERRGTATLELTGPWVAEAGTGVSSTAAARVITLGRDGQTATFDLTSGDIGRLQARLVKPSDIQTAGTLSIEDEKFVGSVNNPLATALREPVVWVGHGSTSLGDRLDPGVATDVTVSAAGPTNFGPIEGPWLGDSFNNYSTNVAPADLRPSALYERATRVSGLGQPGNALLVGWVPLSDIGESIGVGRPDGPALVVIPLTLKAGKAPTPQNAVRAEVVSTDGNLRGFEFGEPGNAGMVINGGRETIVRFALPEGARDGKFRTTGQGLNRFGANFSFAGRPEARVDGDPIAPPQQGKVIVVEDGSSVEVSSEPDFVGRGGATVHVFDFTSRTWVRTKVNDDGSATFTADGRTLVNDGHLYMRFTGLDNGIFATSAVTLEGLAS